MSPVTALSLMHHLTSWLLDRTHLQALYFSRLVASFIIRSSSRIWRDLENSQRSHHRLHASRCSVTTQIPKSLVQMLSRGFGTDITVIKWQYSWRPRYCSLRWAHFWQTTASVLRVVGRLHNAEGGLDQCGGIKYICKFYAVLTTCPNYRYIDQDIRIAYIITFP